MTIKLKTPPARRGLLLPLNSWPLFPKTSTQHLPISAKRSPQSRKLCRKLKLGVSAWHQIAGHEEPDGGFWTRDIGFAQVRNKWGIALRRTWGNYNIDEYAEEVWLFTDAPRWICIESIGKLPDLFDDLIKRTRNDHEDQGENQRGERIRSRNRRCCLRRRTKA